MTRKAGSRSEAGTELRAVAAELRGSSAQAPIAAMVRAATSASNAAAVQEPDTHAGASVGTLIDQNTLAVRDLVGALFAEASRADFAVARIRLAALDLSESELQLVRVRVLLGRLDVDSLQHGPAVAGADAARRLSVLHRFVASGRLHVRVSCLEEWSPDFSVFRLPRRRSGARQVTLVGCHYFAPPLPVTGPAFTCVLEDEAAAALAMRRFDTLWRRGYDVLPIIRQSLEQLMQSAGMIAPR
jgi:hypothetical protein